MLLYWFMATLPPLQVSFANLVPFNSFRTFIQAERAIHDTRVQRFAHDQHMFAHVAQPIQPTWFSKGCVLTIHLVLALVDPIGSLKLFWGKTTASTFATRSILKRLVSVLSYSAQTMALEFVQERHARDVQSSCGFGLVAITGF
jgi:hypothetical protein